MKCIRYFLFLTVIFATNFAHSQYYYNDIIALQQSQKQYVALTDNKIRKISAVSYEGGQPVNDFKLEQQISADARTITITSSDPSTGSLLTINSYNNRKLVQTKDSSVNVSTTTTYQYDASGKMVTLTSKTNDAFMNSHSTEMHMWTYNGEQPAQMLRIKDNMDTTVIELTYDDGNVAQETWKRKGRVAETYYYYYNNNKQLTDIVRFNNRVRKMLPDFLFDYDTEGRVTQMTQVPASSDNYLVWKYTYNSKGLKEKELLYNKQQQLIGRVEYSYN